MVIRKGIAVLQKLVISNLVKMLRIQVKVIVVGDMTIQLDTDNLMENVTNGSVFVNLLFNFIYSSFPLR